MDDEDKKSYDPNSFLLIDDNNVPYIVYSPVFDITTYINYNKYNETFMNIEKALIQSKEILIEKYYNTESNFKILHFAFSNTFISESKFKLTFL